MTEISMSPGHQLPASLLGMGLQEPYFIHAWTLAGLIWYGSLASSLCCVFATVLLYPANTVYLQEATPSGSYSHSSPSMMI